VARYRLRGLLRFLSMYLIVSVLAAAALLVDSWPVYPRSPLEWGLLLVITLPVTVLGDWLSDRALSNSLSLKTKGAKKTRLSWLRIAYGAALYVLFAICAVVILYWLEFPA
jgi:hypothetical protein